MKIGMVAPTAHQSGRTRSAPSPRTVNVSQNIFRSMGQVYSHWRESCRQRLRNAEPPGNVGTEGPHVKRNAGITIRLELERSTRDRRAEREVIVSSAQHHQAVIAVLIRLST